MQLAFHLAATGLVRDLADYIERPRQMSDCLLIGTAPQRLGSRALAMSDSARKLICTLKMLCQFRCNLVKLASPRCL